jgi:hypothetical protein
MEVGLDFANQQSAQSPLNCRQGSATQTGSPMLTSVSRSPTGDVIAAQWKAPAEPVKCCYEGTGSSDR